MGFCGLLLGLSAPGFDLWLLAWVSLIPALWWSGQQRHWKEAACGGAWLGAVFHGLYFCWFWDLHPLTWLGFTEWGSWLVTGAGWLLLVFEGALLCSLLMGVFQQFAQSNRPVWLPIILFPLFWIAVFSLQALTPMALPWAFIEYTQAQVPVIRWLAGWIGGSGIVWLMLLYSTCWTLFLLRRPLLRLSSIIPIIIAPLLLWISSSLPLFNQPMQKWPLPVAVIQGNIPIEIIRSTDLTLRHIEAAYLTPLAHTNLPASTLVVLPEEGVIAGWIDISRPQNNFLAAQLQAISREKRITIAVGASTFEQQGTEQQRYNSILLISPGGFQFYHKRRLVPFGEATPYIPETWLTGALGQFGIHYANVFKAGSGKTLLEIPNQKVKLGGLVCFELIDSAFSREYRKIGTNLLVNTSNLGWFHGNRWLESQFLAIGQFRAAENRLPLVISSNTGISAIISDTGALLKHTSLQKINSQHKPALIFYNGSR